MSIFNRGSLEIKNINFTVKYICSGCKNKLKYQCKYCPYCGRKFTKIKYIDNP